MVSDQSKTEIRAHRADASTDEHKRNYKPFSSTHLTDISYSVKIFSKSKAELQHVLSLVTQQSDDHLGELVNSAFEEDLRLKDQALINNVIAPCMFKDLFRDIRESVFTADR